MNHTHVDVDLLNHARTRCRTGEVGAAFAQDLTERDRDWARRWRFLVVDSVGRYAYVDFIAPGIRPEALLTAPLEDAVERLVVNNYPREVRLAALVAHRAEYSDGIPLHLDTKHLLRPSTA